MLKLRVKPSGGFPVKMACKKNGDPPRYPQPCIIFMDGLFGMDTSDFGGALKATLVGISKNFVRLFFRHGNGRTVEQHELAVCDPLACCASSQAGVAQV